MTNIENPQTPNTQFPSSTISEAPVNIPPNNLITPASVTISPSKKSRFGTFVAISLILIAIIYGVVAYIYYQNQKIKNGTQNTAAGNKGMPTSTPAPIFIPENVKIVDGNVVYKDTTENTKILVNKNDFSGSGIIGFLKLAVSPDKKSVCFESWSPAPKPAVYLSGIDGSNALEVSPNRQNCTWTPDSKNILYINSMGQNSGTDIYIYDVANKIEKNLTFAGAGNTLKKKFDIVGLSADGTTLICNFEYINSQTPGGQCALNLSTLEVSFE